ncbi:assimilatory sulfite reductase (NADPH) flavoprotein subunit [Aquimonas voraii]|uniref:Sulfite reductase (NADPH) alpha subunit n=1 Tax=Aquimonas voraii TaxID=265719 RepID=A0A1G6VNW1_9GAMM|nr:assimilatory sulfite reductase (NADPH) flavoprotein subunit [Aquimonas voraii]SDD54516.1 sulfite reductase (NADPH) alpha subunit [Aquimonas voraii]
MSAFPALPDLSALPLPAATAVVPLARALEGLDPASLWWLSGYAAGLARGALPGTAAAPQATAAAQPRLTVLYGSQTGNAKRAAEGLVSAAESAGFAVRLLRADAYPTRELKDERLLWVVISTQGEGEPPEDSLGFVEFLLGRRAPKLPELKYAVLGLGDSSYPRFCETGRQIDARLAELGAHRLQPLGEADVDIDAVATPWRTRAVESLKALAAELAPSANPGAAHSAAIIPLRPALSAALHSREQPFAAELIEQVRLTGRGSQRDVRHLELSLAGSGLHYAPGDALGVWAPNPTALVDAVLELTRLDGDASLTLDGVARPLRVWLSEHRELTRLAKPLLVALGAVSKHRELHSLLDPAEASSLSALLSSHQLIDVLREWPGQWTAEAFVRALRPMAPRLYSIASSPLAYADEVHLTVDVVGAEDEDPLRLGLASHHLATLEPGARARVFIEENPRFRLPADGERDLIMLGAGTGIAPYRAFVQQRVAEGARGRHWLLFGARSLRDDFLYQTEWQEHLRRGELQHIDLAFSRDAKPRVYVQQRLREQATRLFEWLDGGAHFYVCGSLALGRDVHQTLLDLFAQRLGGAEAATEALQQLQQSGRYARDVY